MYHRLVTLAALVGLGLAVATTGPASASQARRVKGHMLPAELPFTVTVGDTCQDMICGQSDEANCFPDTVPTANLDHWSVVNEVDADTTVESIRLQHPPGDGDNEAREYYASRWSQSTTKYAREKMQVQARARRSGYQNGSAWVAVTMGELTLTDNNCLAGGVDGYVWSTYSIGGKAVQAYGFPPYNTWTGISSGEFTYSSSILTKEFRVEGWVTNTYESGGPTATLRIDEVHVQVFCWQYGPPLICDCP